MLKRQKIIMICCVPSALLLAALAFIIFAGGSGRYWQANAQYVPILMYHSINDTPVGSPELSVTAKSFDDQMKYLASNGYTAINLDDISECAEFKKPIVITFDDGYEDNYSCAYPILKKYHLKATIFMVSKYIGLGGFLTKEQIVKMGNLVSFQSHTVNHERLDFYNLKQVDYECRESQKVLAGITHRPVYALSYPNGMFTAAILRIAAKYYSCAVTTLPGNNSQYCDKMQLRRIGVLRDATLLDFTKSLK